LSEYGISALLHFWLCEQACRGFYETLDQSKSETPMIYNLDLRNDTIILPSKYFNHHFASPPDGNFLKFKEHYVTFGPLADKKQNCMHFAENYFLFVLGLCMTADE